MDENEAIRQMLKLLDSPEAREEIERETRRNIEAAAREDLRAFGSRELARSRVIR